MLPQLPDSFSLSSDQSSFCSNIGDVLIRSTRIRRPEPEPDFDQNSVQSPRLQGSTPVQPSLVQDQQKTTGQPTEDKTPTTADSQTNPDMEVHARTSSGQDLLTSRFSAGGRDVGLAALKQRSHSTSCRKEVRVNLLDPGSLQTHSQDSQDALGMAAVQIGAGSTSGRPCDASGAAAVAAAAAAIAAATAPLIHAQCHIEAQVGQVVDSVQKLLHADRQSGDSGRCLNQQVLQRLETLHGQQLQLQGQLMDSAIKMMSGHADSANVHGTQQQTGPVTIATSCSNHRPQPTSDGYHRGDMTSHSEHNTTKKVDKVLKEMRQLRCEMKTRLKTQPQDSLETTKPLPEHQQTKSQQSESQRYNVQSQQHQSPQEHNQAHPNFSQSHPIQTQQKPSQPTKLRSHQTRTQQNHSQSRKSRSHQLQPEQCQSRVARLSEPVHRGTVVPSMLEEADQVLRQVQRRKKVLEENLDTLLRTNNGEVLRCQLEALAANRESSDQVRIKKTVDAWISTLSRDIQSESSSVVPAAKTAGSCGPSGRVRTGSSLRQTASRTTLGQGGQSQRPGLRTGAEPVGVSGEVPEAESYLTRLYGRETYESEKRTLKKSPYLRDNSSSQAVPARKPRPHLVERVKGVKVKPSKTRTSLAPPLVATSNERPHRQLIFWRSADHADTRLPPADTTALPVAIPLGLRRADTSVYRRPAEPQQEVTSPVACPAAAVNDGAADVVSGIADVVDRAAEGAERQDADEIPPPVIEMKSEEEEEKEEEEENNFPGSNFLSVADVVQAEVSELSSCGEEAVEMDGGPSPPPVQYQGPVFPPQTSSHFPVQNQNSIQDPIQESRLLDWVEQQLMSRMISQMYHPPPPDPTQDLSTDQSDLEEQSVTSDIIEAAGGGGLQLFVDSNVAVDSELIRRLVNEVLSETCALMLGQRGDLEPEPATGAEGTEPEPAAPQEDNLVPLISTPEPTPPQSPISTSRQTTPLNTPPPSESIITETEESPRPISAPDIVTTPTPSSSPPPGSPLSLPVTPPPVSGADAERPVVEERPEEELDTNKLPIVMSVVEEEPLVSVRPQTPPPQPLAPPPPDLSPASPSSSSESTSTSSTSVSTGTDAVISEGHLLVSVHQLTNTTTEEDGAIASLDSSLQELQDMHEEDVSMGEVRTNQKTAQKQHHSSSPGQIPAGLSELHSAAANHHSDTLNLDLSLSPQLDHSGQVADFLFSHPTKKNRAEEEGEFQQEEEELWQRNRELPVTAAERQEVIKVKTAASLDSASSSSSSSDAF